MCAENLTRYNFLYTVKYLPEKYKYKSFVLEKLQLHGRIYQLNF